MKKTLRASRRSPRKRVYGRRGEILNLGSFPHRGDEEDPANGDGIVPREGNVGNKQ